MVLIISTNLSQKWGMDSILSDCKVLKNSTNLHLFAEIMPISKFLKKNCTCKKHIAADHPLELGKRLVYPSVLSKFPEVTEPKNK